MLQAERDVTPAGACPLCHTIEPGLTHSDVEAGRGWRCARCGQRWTVARLHTIAAYDASVLGRDTGLAL